MVGLRPTALHVSSDPDDIYIVIAFYSEGIEKVQTILYVTGPHRDNSHSHNVLFNTEINFPFSNRRLLSRMFSMYIIQPNASLFR